MLPPRHRLTHTPEFIPPEDDAWDMPRANREIALAQLREADAHELLRGIAAELDAVPDGDEPVSSDDLMRKLTADDRAHIAAALEHVHGLTIGDAVTSEQLRACADAIEASPWASRDEHPLWAYWLGTTRKDLRLVAPYLRRDAQPVKFTLRLLTRVQRIEVEAILRSNVLGSEVHAALRAAQYGLVKVDGPGAPKLKAWEKGKAPELTTRDLDTLEDAFGLDMLAAVGHAIMGYSRDLFESKKKV